MLPALTATASLPAAATEEAANRMFSVRGFGTLGAVHSSEKNADFVSGFFEPNGAGHTRNWAVGVDSKLGLQVTGTVTPKVSAVLQFVSQHHYDNAYWPWVEWANVKYDPSPDLSLRVGRTLTAPFLVSESRLIGYSNPWIRPPQEVYGLVPLTNKDGADATYRLNVGDMTSTVHASLGRARAKLPAGANVKARRYFDVADTIEYGAMTLRASYSTARVDLHTANLDALTAGFSQLGSSLSAVPGLEAASAQAISVAERYRFTDAPISVIAVGASYDRAAWLVMAEWAKFNGHSILADSRAWYVTAGRRFAELMPYVTVARLHAEKNSEAGIATAGLPPAAAASAVALNGGVNLALAGATFAQRSGAIGIRWDVHKNVALKFQYDRVKLDAGSSGRLGNAQPNFQPGGRVHVVSFAADFVF
jgi:hypothetical protein